jgi:hypothetical protein
MKLGEVLQGDFFTEYIKKGRHKAGVVSGADIDGTQATS